MFTARRSPDGILADMDLTGSDGMTGRDSRQNRDPIEYHRHRPPAIVRLIVATPQVGFDVFCLRQGHR